MKFIIFLFFFLLFQGQCTMDLSRNIPRVYSYQLFKWLPLQIYIYPENNFFIEAWILRKFFTYVPKSGFYNKPGVTMTSDIVAEIKWKMILLKFIPVDFYRACFEVCKKKHACKVCYTLLHLMLIMKNGSKTYLTLCGTFIHH